jgi:plastocyanin
MGVVRLRKRYLSLICILGTAVAVLPAIASSETSATIEAVNEGGSYGYGQTHHWSPMQATVGEGGVVTLSNSTDVAHGVEWRSGPENEKPTCSSGVPVGTTPAASGTSWSGTCKFTKPGTYTFWCTVHGPEMTGTVTVSANGTTTTTMTMPTPTTPTTTTAPPGGSSSEAPSGSPLAGGAATAVKLASRQRGKTVHGSVYVSPAGAGGRLEVTLLATGASLAQAKRPAKMRVGRLSRSPLQAGIVSFAVPLTARGRSALRRHRRLALTVQLVLTPMHGAAVTVTRSVVEHA